MGYPMMCFYGVGNHGGGPTVRHLQLLEQYKREHPEKELIYSDLHDFFEEVRGCGHPVPELRDDLQRRGLTQTDIALRTGYKSRQAIAALRMRAMSASRRPRQCS